MTDANPERWGGPKALAKRGAVAAEVEKHLFESVRVARCGGSPPVWEIAVRVHDLDKLYVFRIAGGRASELRMLDIANNLTPSCAQEDISSDPSSLDAQLPW